MSRTRSQVLQSRAEQFFPGGVNSPVRAFRAVGGAPPFSVKNLQEKMESRLDTRFSPGYSDLES